MRKEITAMKQLTSVIARAAVSLWHALLGIVFSRLLTVVLGWPSHPFPQPQRKDSISMEKAIFSQLLCTEVFSS